MPVPYKRSDLSWEPGQFDHRNTTHVAAASKDLALRYIRLKSIGGMRRLGSHSYNTKVADLHLEVGSFSRTALPTWRAGLRPPTRRLEAWGRRAKGCQRAGWSASYGPPWRTEGQAGELKYRPVESPRRQRRATLLEAFVGCCVQV